VRFWSPKGEGESKNNETTAAFLREPSEQMIQSRSLPGYQVSSSLTGGGVERKLGAFAIALRFQTATRPDACVPLIALFVVRSSRIYCLYCRNRSVDSRQAQTA
jgi:hypothetical protein